MPFPPQTPRSFDLPNVEAITPGQIGVYGLLRNGAFVYIGKGDIRERLLAHLRGDNVLIAQHGPTHWVDEVVKGDPSSREKTLIIEFAPICNRRVG